MAGSPSAAAAFWKSPLSILSDEEREFLAPRIQRKHFKAGESILREGQPSRGLYVVQSGSVKMFRSSSDGDQVWAVRGPGDLVGEFAVTDGGNYPVSATASTESDLLLIEQRDLDALFALHPPLRIKLAETAASRVRPLTGVIEQLSFGTVRQRLAAFLLQLAAKNGKLTADGIEVKLTSTRADLAKTLGTVADHVSRSLSFFQARGLIRVRGKLIVIPNPEALQTEAATRP